MNKIQLWQQYSQNIDKIKFLQVTSFVGLDPDASHFYGKIKGDKLDVSRELTEEEAMKLASDDGDINQYFLYVNEGTIRFDTLEQLYGAAVRRLVELGWDNCVLLEGEHYIAQPQRTIYAKDQTFYDLNDLFDRFKKLEWDSAEEEEKGKISLEWVKLLLSKLEKL